MTEMIINAQVEQITPLSDSIMLLVLSPEHYIDYHAGQYLQIIIDNEPLSYSIANAPLGSKKYELHIRHSSDNSYNQRLFAHIKEHGSVLIRLPFGTCSLQRLDSLRPIFFIAGGTGFAPIKAMIEQLLSSADKRPIELFWGARLQNDLYMHEKVMHWNTCVSHFNFYPLLSEHASQSLDELVISKHEQHLHQAQIVISGPFDMVYRIRDCLVNHGALVEHLYSDAFDFEVN